jgi:hypothetical protein
MLFKRLKIYALYLEKEQKFGEKMTIPCGISRTKFFCVRAFVLNLGKEDPPKLYKNEYATE